MFIHCPHCQALVATDPATDAPPARCPRCLQAIDAGGGKDADAAPDPEATPAVLPSPGLLTAAPAAPTPAAPGDAAAAAPGDAAEDLVTTDTSLDASPSGDALDQSRQDAPADGPRRGHDTPANALAKAPVQVGPAAIGAPGDAESAIAQDGGPAFDRAPASAPAKDLRGDPARDPASEPASEPARADPAGDRPTPASGSDPAVGPVLPPRADDCDGEPGADAVDAEPAADNAHPAATDPAEAHGAPSPAAPPSPSSVAARPQAPAFARRHRRAARAGRRWPQAVVIFALSVLLATQWLLADRARFAADARWRPVLAGACAMLGCALPPWREPDALTLLARDVRAHPDLAGVLHASATFRNDARWAQPWPRVVLTLADVEGRAVGERALTPSDYLGRDPTGKGLASGQVATIAFDVLEPGPSVVSFAFEFD